MTLGTRENLFFRLDSPEREPLHFRKHLFAQGGVEGRIARAATRREAG